MKRFLAIVGLVMIVLLLPAVFWLLRPAADLAAVVITDSGEETQSPAPGVDWLLEHQKVPADQVDWQANQFSDYSNRDVFYLLGQAAATIDLAAWQALQLRLDQSAPSLFITEYGGSLPNARDPQVTAEMNAALGLETSAWSAKYFDELDPAANETIPEHILNSQSEWPYAGSGVVFANNETGQVVVLEARRHFAGNSLAVAATKAFTAETGQDFSADYTGWFNVLLPGEETQTLLTYDFGVNEAGKKLLADHGLPSEFPALTQYDWHNSRRFYFAGLFSQVSQLPSMHQMLGLPQLYQSIERFSSNNSYWSTYYPIVADLLTAFAAEAKAETASKDQTTADQDQANQLVARIKDDQYEVLVNDHWEKITLKGVNLGMGKPGTFPGEAAITYDEYLRWFGYIAEMQANVLRVYTLQPPAFYKALAHFNADRDQPLYVMHGAWINEEQLVESQDAFYEPVLKDFQQEMGHIVDAIHGNTVIAAQTGHSAGVYGADVSEYVIGWIIGIEWDPFMVIGTNDKHQDIGDFAGQYFETKAASPFENWLAQQMEYIVSYEMAHYQAARPISFTNWVMTDLLDHPSDSSGKEDIVSVDPNTIYTKDVMQEVGQFASYHIYPYYPEYMQYEQKYQDFTDHRGEMNAYAAYLAELKSKHRLPLVVAEFGVPSSRGRSHAGPDSKHQGQLTETQQGEINSQLFEDILAADYLGGLVFTWQDEWFKRVWNTMEYDNQERRPFWSNAQSSEQQFGLLSFDSQRIKVDGQTADWQGGPVYGGDEDAGPLTALYVDHDETNLYLRVDTRQHQSDRIVLLLDTIPGQGNTTIDGINGLKLSPAVDFIADIKGDESRLQVDGYYDAYNLQYGLDLGQVPADPVNPAKDTGQFNPIYQVLNSETYLADSQRTIPFQNIETGRLTSGNGNPASADYNSLADYTLTADGVLELRIPWLLLQFRDPSQKEVMGNIIEDGISASLNVDGISIGALLLDENNQVIDSFPEIKDSTLAPLQTYTWDNWQLPTSQERLKESYYVMQETFSKY